MRIRRGRQAHAAGAASHRRIEGGRFAIVVPAKRDAMRLRQRASKLLARWERGALAAPKSVARRLAY